MADKNKRILMAVIGKAQGLSGLLRLKFFTETAQDLGRYQRFYSKDGTEYRVKAWHIHKGVPLAAFAGVDNREQAEKLAGLELFVTRSQFADDLQADEFYQEDLLGFAAHDEAGDIIGHISGFFNFGGGDLLEITLLLSGAVKRPAAAGGAAPKAKKALIPFSKAAVPEIIASAGAITVNRRAAGLAFDDDKTAGAEELSPAAGAKRRQ